MAMITNALFVLLFLSLKEDRGDKERNGRLGCLRRASSDEQLIRISPPAHFLLLLLLLLFIRSRRRVDIFSLFSVHGEYARDRQPRRWWWWRRERTDRTRQLGLDRDACRSSVPPGKRGFSSCSVPFHSIVSL